MPICNDNSSPTSLPEQDPCNPCTPCTSCGECSCTCADPGYLEDGCYATQSTDCTTYNGDDDECLDIKKDDIFTTVFSKVINFVKGIFTRVTSDTLDLTLTGDCNQSLEINLRPDSIVIEDTPCLTWTKSVLNGSIVFTPIVDFGCFCDNCEVSPCDIPTNLVVTITGGEASLSWTPGGPDGNQTVQYKAASTGSYTDFSTLSSGVSNETIDGLDENTLYNFRIVNNCVGGTPTSSNIIQAIEITCPDDIAVEVAPDPDNEDASQIATVTFSNLGIDIYRYTIELRNAAGSTVLNSAIEIASCTSTPGCEVSRVFNGIVLDSSYKIKVIPFVGSFSRTNCTLFSFTA